MKNICRLLAIDPLRRPLTDSGARSGTSTAVQMVTDIVAGVVGTIGNLKPVIGEKSPNETACAVLLSVPSFAAKVMATDADRTDSGDRIPHALKRKSLRALNIYF